MFKDTRGSKESDGTIVDRRTLLRATAVGGVLSASAGLAAGNRAEDDSRGGNSGSPNAGGGNGFPPNGITTYGRSVNLGNGEVRPFTTETPSGDPKYHGVEFDRAALEGLPTASDLVSADNRDETDKYRVDGQAVEVHFKQSLQFFVPFPDAAETPFTFLGLNYNPEGHYGGKGAWLKPHFDIHFHMLDPATVDSIEGPALPPYDTGNGEYSGGSPKPDADGKVTETGFDYDQLPEGYGRAPEPVADQRYIRDMGEHTAPGDAPELPDGPGDTGDPDAFSNTLIQGFISTDGGGSSRLAFVEPMITRDYLEEFSGQETFTVPQPAAYPHDQQHPQKYSVRDLPQKDAVAVVLEAFEQV